MAFMNPFKVPKHQRYKYIPRYWEPEKEDLQERVRQASNEGNTNATDMKSRISRGFQRRAYVRGNPSSSGTRRSNLILVAAVIGLCYLTFLLLGKYMPVIEKWLQ